MVGIGVPLIIAILVVIYMFCIRPKKTDFIDSNGNVVTAYRKNKFTNFWYSIMGKPINPDEYESNSPLGSGNSDLENEIHDDDSNPNGVNRTGTVRSDRNGGSGLATTDFSGHSNDLILEEEKFYDEDGNELNARNY